MPDLNDVVEEVVQDSDVVTVPIDATLTVSGEAADAKAVGDALANKADRSELSTAVNVNGQTPDAQGNILLYANDVPMSDEDATTIKEAIEDIQDWDAGDINVDDSSVDPETVQHAITELQARTGANIYTDANHTQTISQAIADFTDAQIQQMLIDAGYEEE